MTRFLNKWLRVFHRWISIPVIILIPLALVTKFSGGVKFIPPQAEQLQSILILFLAISGAYLFLIPYFAKWQRNRRQKKQQEGATAVQGGTQG